MKEHREIERFTLELPAKIKIVQGKKGKEEDEEVFELFTGNVSSGGAFFHTEKPLSAGTQVKIDLILPLDRLKKIEGKKACIKVNGKVLRTGTEGMAIRFNKRYTIVPLDEE